MLISKATPCGETAKVLSLSDICMQIQIKQVPFLDENQSTTILADAYHFHSVLSIDMLLFNLPPFVGLT